MSFEVHEDDLSKEGMFRYSNFSLIPDNGTIFGSSGLVKDSNCTDCVNELCIPEADYEVYRSWVSVDTFEMVLIALNIIVFLAGIIGNSLVFIAVTTTKSMQSVTNIFIVNLAMADMLVMLFCAPPSVIWDVTNTWIFGSLMCRIVIYIQDISVSVSVLTLTFIAYDRYYAICRPLQFSSRKTKAAVVIAAIWTISGMIGIPDAVSLRSVSPFTKEEYPCRDDVIQFDLSTCKPTWSDNVDFFFTLTKALLLYTLPLIFMCVAYYHIVRTLWRRNNIPGSQETTDGAGSNSIQQQQQQQQLQQQQQRMSSAGLVNTNSASAISLASTPGGATTPPVSTASHSRLSILSRSSTFRVLRFKINSSNSNRNGNMKGSPDGCPPPPVASTPTTSNRLNPSNRTLDNQLRTRRKVAKMLIAVVIMFSINFFPVHFLPIVQFVVDHTLQEGSPAYERAMLFLVNGSIITHCMCYFNSAINPIIYYFMSAQFKAQYRRILSCRCVADAPSPRFGQQLQAHKKMNSGHYNSNNHRSGGLLHQRQAQSMRIPMAMTSLSTARLGQAGNGNCSNGNGNGLMNRETQPFRRTACSISSPAARFRTDPGGYSPRQYRPILERSRRFEDPIEENSMSMTDPLIDPKKPVNLVLDGPNSLQCLLEDDSCKVLDLADPPVVNLGNSESATEEMS